VAVAFWELSMGKNGADGNLPPAWLFLFVHAVDSDNKSFSILFLHQSKNADASNINMINFFITKYWGQCYVFGVSNYAL
jgi:hypothetical protein